MISVLVHARLMRTHLELMYNSCGFMLKSRTTHAELMRSSLGCSFGVMWGSCLGSSCWAHLGLTLHTGLLLDSC